MLCFGQKSFFQPARGTPTRTDGDVMQLKEKLKTDLLEQLERNGTYGQYYIDLVSDYMELWEIKNALIADIDKRGVVVEYTSDRGSTNFRKNESVSELVRVNDRMIKLLDAIGITPAQAEGDEDDEM